MQWQTIVLIGIVFFSGCVNQTPNPPTNADSSNTTPNTTMEGSPMDGKAVQFNSLDGFVLVGTLWENKNSDKPPIVLLHQLNRDRHSYDAFAKKLWEKGFPVLSFDLRGHGESVRKGTKTVYFTEFSEADFQLIPTDILQAKDFLKAEKIMVVGASIGANSALIYAAQDPSSPGVVLLSPGTNYRGVDITTSSKQKNVPMLVVASKEDTYSAQSSQSLFQGGPLLDKKLILLDNAGHGTDMFLRSPDLEKAVLDWIEEHA